VNLTKKGVNLKFSFKKLKKLENIKQAKGNAFISFGLFNVFNWTQFKNPVQKFLNLKKCDRIGTKRIQILEEPGSNPYPKNLHIKF
jgi:hypothetical protein